MYDRLKSKAIEQNGSNSNEDLGFRPCAVKNAQDYSSRDTRQCPPIMLFLKYQVQPTPETATTFWHFRGSGGVNKGTFPGGLWTDAAREC